MTRFPPEARLTGVPAMVASAPPGVSTVPAIETEEGSEIVKVFPATITIGLAASVLDVFVPDPSLGFAIETATPLMFAADPGLFGSLSISLPKMIVVGFGPV